MLIRNKFITSLYALIYVCILPGESSEGSDSEETTMMLKRVHENRKAAENMAKALLQRLDRSCGTMVCHVPGCTLQPWEDVSSHSHTR